MSCNNCKCNTCVKKPICGCPITLSSECVKYTVNKRLDVLNVNEGDTLQDILIKLESFLSTLIVPETTAQLMDGKLVYTATGGETTINIPDLVNINANFMLVRNGQVELEGVGNEYTINNITNTINLLNPLNVGNIIQFYYYKQT